MKEYQKQNHQDLHNILHPYIFVLKEGSTIDQNLLDYSLLMLKVSNQEVIQSPGSGKVMQLLPTALALNPAISGEQNKSFFQEKP